MMRGAGGAVVVAVAAMLVCCSADPHQDQDGGGEHSSADRYDSNAYEYIQTQELEDFLRYLAQYENLGRTQGLGGSSLLGRNSNGLGDSMLLGRNLGLGGSSLLGRNLGNLGGSTLLGRGIPSSRYSRFVDSLGGGNLVRNLDSLGGGNLVRNLDSLGGGNLVKKNLDQLGGPNLVKRTLDSLGGGNLVRNLDSLGGGNLNIESTTLSLEHLLESVKGNKDRGHKTRNLDSLGGGHLIRDVRETPRHLAGLLPYLLPRQHNIYAGSKREPWSLREPYGFYDLQKRNFDEIDRSDLNPFVGKRNFDEIDQTSMPFPYAIKRFYPLYGNYLDTPMELYRSNFDKKRLRPEYPMDEIDLSHFPIGSKRSLGISLDDIDRAALNKQRRAADFPMDEIDVSHFPIGSRRSLARR